MFQQFTAPIINDVICKLINELEQSNYRYNQLRESFDKYKGSVIDNRDKELELNSLQKAYDKLNKEKEELEKKIGIKDDEITLLKSKIKSYKKLEESHNLTVEQYLKEKQDMYDRLNAVLDEVSKKITKNENDYPITLVSIAKRNQELNDLNNDLHRTYDFICKEVIYKSKEENQTLTDCIEGDSIDQNKVDEILNKDNKEESEKITQAAKDGNIEVVKSLLKAGADVNAKDEDGWTALIWAAYNGYTEIVKLLLEAGADIEAKDVYGRTALIEAAFDGKTEVVKLLLDAGAVINAKSEDGWTALILAASYGYTEIAKLLLEAGANPNVKEEVDGLTPLMKATRYGYTEIVNLLLEAGADVNIKSNIGYIALDCAEKDSEIYSLLFHADDNSP